LYKVPIIASGNCLTAVEVYTCHNGWSNDDDDMASCYKSFTPRLRSIV